MQVHLQTRFNDFSNYELENNLYQIYLKKVDLSKFVDKYTDPIILSIVTNFSRMEKLLIQFNNYDNLNIFPQSFNEEYKELRQFFLNCGKNIKAITEALMDFEKIIIEKNKIEINADDYVNKFKHNIEKRLYQDNYIKCFLLLKEYIFKDILKFKNLNIVLNLNNDNRFITI